MIRSRGFSWFYWSFTSSWYSLSRSVFPFLTHTFTPSCALSLTPSLSLFPLLNFSLFLYVISKTLSLSQYLLSPFLALFLSIYQSNLHYYTHSWAIIKPEIVDDIYQQKKKSKTLIFLFDVERKKLYLFLIWSSGAVLPKGERAYIHLTQRLFSWVEKH